VIRARFENRCACGRTIREGDNIGLVDGEWVCEECVDGADGGEDPGADDR
jgi:hypothetical protein